MATQRIPLVADFSGSGDDIVIESLSELGISEVLGLEVGGTGVQTLEELKELLGLDLSTPIEELYNTVQPLLDDIISKQALLDDLLYQISQLPTSFLGLSDTPNTYIANKAVYVNSQGTELTFRDSPSGLPDMTNALNLWLSVQEISGNKVAYWTQLPSGLPDPTGKSNYYLISKSDGSGYELSSSIITNKYKNII